MRIKKIKLIVCIILVTVLISCGSTKNLFNQGSAELNHSVEEVDIQSLNDIYSCKVIIAGNEYNFMIDTGAPTIISEELYTKLNLKPAYEKDVTDTNKSKRKQIFTTLPEIKIGNIIFQNIGSVVMDIKTSGVSCWGFDGIVGSNLLAKLHWKFNYSENKIFATADINNFNQEYDYVFPFEVNPQKTPGIKGKLLGKELKFTIDTGYNGRISVANDYQYYKSQTTDENFIINAGSNTIGFYGIDNIKYNFILKNNIYFENHLFENEMINSGSSTLIGNEFLNNFIFTFDWKTNKIYLKAIKKIEKKPIESFGFLYSFKGNKAFVVSKFQNHQIPIEINDEILKINDVDFSDLKDNESCKYFLTKVENGLKTIDITVKRKNETLNYTLNKKVFLK